MWSSLQLVRGLLDVLQAVHVQLCLVPGVKGDVQRRINSCHCIHQWLRCCAVRALKMHGGGPPVTAGQPLDATYRSENVQLLIAGCCNLQRHIANMAAYGVPVVVAINRFATDTDAELAAVKQAATDAGECCFRF